MSMYVLSIMHKILYKNEYEFAITNSIFFSIGSSSSADLSKNTVFIPEKKGPVPHENNEFSRRIGSQVITIVTARRSFRRRSHRECPAFLSVQHKRSKPISRQPPDLRSQYRSDASSP